MSYEQYWYGDPLMVGAFRKAQKIRQEHIDMEAWLHGTYIVQALQAVVGNMFLPKNKTPFSYPEEPLLQKERIERENQTREKTLAEEEAEVRWAEAYLDSLMEAGKNWGKFGSV